MSKRTSLRDQLQRNTVALISLIIAITSLGYNTWRNEATEHNRNQRAVSIEILRNIGDLQKVVYFSHWAREDSDKGDPLIGWALVLTIRDLSQLLDAEAPNAGTKLWKTWDSNWEGLGTKRDSYDRIIDALQHVRDTTNALLRDLD